MSAELERQFGSELVNVLRETEKVEDGWLVIEELPENMVLGLNIRERDDNFVGELAKSIVTQGQIQECTGDTLPDGQIRVWAGQHRYWAVEAINQEVVRYNSIVGDEILDKRKLRVRVKSREFSEDEILEIQIAENLHKDMEPEEEAEAINSVYDFYRKRLEERGEAPSISGFARRIGLGESKVGNAIKYHGMEAKVKSLVQRDALLYSYATIISRVPPDKQLEVAIKTILHNLDRNQVEILVKQTLNEEETEPLFSEEQRVVLNNQNHRIAFRTSADRAAKDAAGYFKRIIRVLDLVSDPTKVEMTDTIRDILADFVKSAVYFQLELGDKNLMLLESIQQQATKMIVEDASETVS